MRWGGQHARNRPAGDSPLTWRILLVWKLTGFAFKGTMPYMWLKLLAPFLIVGVIALPSRCCCIQAMLFAENHAVSHPQCCVVPAPVLPECCACCKSESDQTVTTDVAPSNPAPPATPHQCPLCINPAHDVVVLTDHSHLEFSVAAISYQIYPQLTDLKGPGPRNQFSKTISTKDRMLKQHHRLTC